MAEQCRLHDREFEAGSETAHRLRCCAHTGRMPAKHACVSLTVSTIPDLADDDAIESFTRADPGWKVAFTEGGSLIVHPTFCDSGARDLEAAGRLRDFAKATGGKALGSSTSFRVPCGGLNSPDAAWIAREHLESLAPNAQRKFGTVCPDVVIDYVRSGARYAVESTRTAATFTCSAPPPAGLPLNIDRSWTRSKKTRAPVAHTLNEAC